MKSLLVESSNDANDNENNEKSKKEMSMDPWKSARGGMAIVKMATFVGAKNLCGGLQVLKECITEDGIVMPPGNEKESNPTTTTEDDDKEKEDGDGEEKTNTEAKKEEEVSEVPPVQIPTYTPEQIAQHQATIRLLSNISTHHYYNYNIPDPIPPDMTIPVPPPQCSDASIPHHLLEVLTMLRLRYEESGGFTEHPTNDGNNVTSSLQLDANKLAAAAGGTYDEDADPLNAAEVVNAVLEFKRNLEERDGKSRVRRVEVITGRLGSRVAELVEKMRVERKRLSVLSGEEAGVAPEVGGDAKMEDTGKRGVSNLPAWMTKGTETTSESAPTDTTVVEEEDGNKRKFVPSEANRDDINVRKRRIDTGGATVAEIRAANQAADNAANATFFTEKQDILASSTMFPPLSITPSTSPEQIKTYVTDKIVEYLGEEETTMIEFIMKELGKGCKTVGLLEEMKMVLDEDAEEFVLGLYKRMTE